MGNGFTLGYERGLGTPAFRCGGAGLSGGRRGNFGLEALRPDLATRLGTSQYHGDFRSGFFGPSSASHWLECSGGVAGMLRAAVPHVLIGLDDVPESAAD
jgi:hypothetical protein